jgi:cytochrome c-type biogenesis protein CcmH/NrfG
VDTSLNLDLHRQVVETMMDAEEPFGEVETFIDDAVALDHDEKAALWLLAWSSRERPVQRREALAMLGALAWRPSPGQMPEEV